MSSAHWVDGFNDMAQRVQTVHQNLEGRVAEKTVNCRKSANDPLRRSGTITSLVASATSPQELTSAFVQRLRRSPELMRLHCAGRTKPICVT